MIQKPIKLLSALALVITAGASSTALAHGGSHEPGPQRPVVSEDYRHKIFHQKEAQNERQFAEYREGRIRHLREQMATERRQVLVRYGRRSPEYRMFQRRWEKKWEVAFARERASLIQEREFARRRHEEYHVAVGDNCRTDREAIDRELARYGFGERPWDDNYRGPAYGGAGRDGRDGRDGRYGQRNDPWDNVDVNADVGFRVRVHN